MDGFAVHYLFGHERENWFLHVTVGVGGGRPALPSLAPFHYPASRFEREIRDLLGIRLAGIRTPARSCDTASGPSRLLPAAEGRRARATSSDDGQPFPFTQVGGEGVYEIPVGPVHAGIIEPGHFRFSVVGETIIDMKSRLYFTHKGTEKLFEGRTPEDGVELAERVSGRHERRARAGLLPGGRSAERHDRAAAGAVPAAWSCSSWSACTTTSATSA